MNQGRDVGDMPKVTETVPKLEPGLRFPHSYPVLCSSLGPYFLQVTLNPDTKIIYLLFRLENFYTLL